MSDPSSPAATPATPDPAFGDLGHRCETLKLLAQEAQYAVSDGDRAALTAAVERLLPLHVQFAQAYRMWLAREYRVLPGESMSV